MEVDHDAGCAAFVGELALLLEIADGLTDHELLAASRCHGWTVGDVLVHVRLGVEEMLLGIVSPTDEPPTVDAATYWSAPLPGDSDAIGQIRRVRLLASSYARPRGIVRQLSDVAHTVSAAASRLGRGQLAFQGHVIETGDFLATWAVELAVHHLDLSRELTIPDPTPAALALSRSTVEELAGGSLPTDLSDVEAVLIGTGRRPVPDTMTICGLRLPALG